MTLQDLLNEYLKERQTEPEKKALQTIRAMAGAFNPDYAINLLAIIVQITRLEAGDLDEETFRDMLDLKRGDNDSSST